MYFASAVRPDERERDTPISQHEKTLPTQVVKISAKSPCGLAS